MKSERNLGVSPSERRLKFGKFGELARAALAGIKDSLVGDTSTSPVGYVILGEEMMYDSKTADALGLPTTNDEGALITSLPLSKARGYLEARREELDGVCASSGIFASALEYPAGMGGGASFDDMVSAQLRRVGRTLAEIDNYLEPTDI